MFIKLYLLAGLLAHASLLALLLRALENGGIALRDSLGAILSQGAILFDEAAEIVTDAYEDSVLLLPYAEEDEEDGPIEEPFDDSVELDEEFFLDVDL